MAIEQFANGAQTTLNGAINSTATSLVVASASGFPTAGNFRLLVDSEIMLVTAVSGTTFTVTRAQEGTSGASHSDTVAVTHVLTAGAINQFRADNISSGTYSARPSAAKAGRHYHATDGGILLVDNGSSLDAYGPLEKWTLPDNSLFSWVNQGSAAVTDKGVLSLACPQQNTGDNLNMRVKGIPQTAPWSVTAKLSVLYPTDATWLHGGMIIYDSVSQKGTAFGYGLGFVAKAIHASSGGTSWATVSSFNIYSLGVPRWWKLKDDGTNISFSFSFDGINFVKVYSEARTSFMTNAPDKVGFYGECHTSTSPYDQTVVSLYSWAEGT